MRAALVLCVACWLGVWAPVVRAQTYPGAGKYYSSAGVNGATTCTVAACSSLPACLSYEYRNGCGGNETGACTSCTNTKTVNQYYSSSGLLTNNCGLTSKTQCTAGFKNTNANDISAGTCSSCGALTAGRYYTVPTSPTDVSCPSAARVTCTQDQYDANYNNPLLPASCTNSAAPTAGQYVNNTANPGTTTYFPKTTCPAGQKITAADWSNPLIAGTCESAGTSPTGYYYIANTLGVATQTANTALCNTSSVYAACTSGQYVSGCTNLNMGTCTACTNGAANQIYSGKGGWNNNCPVVGCTLPGCAADEYAAGCGVAGSTGLTCAKCTGATVDVSFYFATGAYTPTSCTIQTCVPCSAGTYKLGCNGTNPGTCVGCTNTV